LIQEGLHKLDLQAGGAVQVPEPITNPETNDDTWCDPDGRGDHIQPTRRRRHNARSRQGDDPGESSSARPKRAYDSEQLHDNANKSALPAKNRFLGNSFSELQPARDRGNSRRPQPPLDDFAATMSIAWLAMISAPFFTSLRPPNNSKPAWRPCASSRIRPTPGGSFIRDSIDDSSFLARVRPSVRRWQRQDCPGALLLVKCSTEYWVFEYVSISQMILRGPVKYGQAFLHTETDENDLTYFIIYHLAVINRAIDELHQYIEKPRKGASITGLAVARDERSDGGTSGRLSRSFARLSI